MIFLNKAALDIISIFTTPPPSIIVTLEAGDPVNNTLSKITQALQ